MAKGRDDDELVFVLVDEQDNARGTPGVIGVGGRWEFRRRLVAGDKRGLHVRAVL